MGQVLIAYCIQVKSRFKTRPLLDLTDEKGQIHIPDSPGLPAGRRVLVTVLDETPHTAVNEEALLSEVSLAEDWNRPEEDEAWRFLNREA